MAVARKWCGSKSVAAVAWRWRGSEGVWWQQVGWQQAGAMAYPAGFLHFPIIIRSDIDRVARRGDAARLCGGVVVDVVHHVRPAQIRAPVGVWMAMGGWAGGHP